MSKLELFEELCKKYPKIKPSYIAYILTLDLNKIRKRELKKRRRKNEDGDES